MLASPKFREKVARTRLTLEAFNSYTETHATKKLQLGAGMSEIPGWFSTDLSPPSPDVHYLDVTMHFPFEDKTFDFVYAEHLIEHLTYEEGAFMLKQCHRVLKPGGTIRITTPDLATLIGLYTNAPDELQVNYIRYITDNFIPGAKTYSPVFVINNAFRNWEHKFLYDSEILTAAMKGAGFVKVEKCLPNTSEHEHLKAVEMHGTVLGRPDINDFEILVLEGSRPS